MAVRKSVSIRQLTIVNWNANGLRMKRACFITFLSIHSIDIACVTETHFLSNETFNVPGYKIYRKDRTADTASGGVAIIIKRSINHHALLLPDVHELETVGIKIYCHDSDDFVLICAYKPPKFILNVQYLALLFPTIGSTLLLGDLNCKHVSWGCRVTNPNGTRLLDCINAHGLHILAPSEPTYYSYNPAVKPDILDIGIHKNMQYPTYVSSLTELDSDHCPVLITFQLNPNVTSQNPRLIDGYVNWDNFQSTLDSKLCSAYNLQKTTDIDNAVQCFTNSICSSIKDAKCVSNRPRFRFYLPKHILQLIQEKHRIRRQWQRERQPWQKTKLNKLICRVKFELEKHRLNSYQTYLSTLSTNDNTLWQATKRVLREPVTIPSLRVASQVFLDTETKCNILATHYETTFSPNISDDDANTKNIESELQENMNKPTVSNKVDFTSPQELIDVIKRLPNKKAPGHDLIPNIVLKNLTKKALAYLTSIYNASMRIGYFPRIWKLAEIIVFHKPNKSKHLPSSYRPISLLPTLSKLFEKILHKRMSKFVFSNNIIPAFQFGFRPKHSTTHQLLRITESILKGFDRREHTAAIFLDIAQAFDRVWHEGLLLKLYRIGLPDYLIHTVKSFLTERQFLVRIDGFKSTPRPITAGVPQGSILAPLLFNIFMYDLPTLEPTCTAMYADDTVLFCSHSDINTAISSLQSSLSLMTEWFTIWRISLNVNKTEAKIFSLRYYQDPALLYLLNEHIPWLPPQSPVKYLGVLLDTKLTWNAHITRVVALATSRIIKLYPLVNRRTSLGLECSMLLYTSLVRPLITYAAPIWGAASKTHIHRLQVVQNKFLRKATNAPWYVRNSQLHNELGILPIQEYIRTLSKSFYSKLLDVPGASVYNIGQKSLNRSRLKRKLPQDVLSEIEESDNPV